MSLRLRTKVFLGLFFLAGLMTLTSGYIFYYFQAKAIREDFKESHNSIANVISNNLKQAENLTDQMMLNTAYGLEEIVNKGVPSKIELQKLRDKFKVTDFYIINKKGKFIRSTDDFAETTNFNFFNFCGDYKDLVSKPFLIDQTPILLAHPPNNEKPYKFTHLTSRDKNYIIEVGIHLAYIQNILKTSLTSYPAINMITLKTPSDQVLGQIKSNNNSGDILKIVKYVDASDSQCCQCKTKKLTDGKYFYKLEFDVSTVEMNRALKRILNTITILEIFLILICLFVSRIVSRSILKKFESLALALDTISATGDLQLSESKLKDKDLESITESFNRMIRNLIEKENRIVESEKLKTHYNLSNQVAHDIRSPLEMLKGIKEDLALLPEDSRRRIQLGINRIEEITFNLLKANKQESISDNLSEPQELLGLILSVVTEKKIEYRNNEKVEFIDHLGSNSFGLFSRANRSNIKSILSNLINNAIESFSNGSGRVEISLDSDHGVNVIKIKDNGPGISETVASKLFTKGFTTKKLGNGLGLVNAKHDLETIGGSLTFESEVGKGTTFTITLPKSDIPPSFIDAIHAYKYERIIVLDDDPSFHDVWSKRLEGLESKIEHIYSVEEMFSKYQALHPKILLLSDFELMDTDYDGIDTILKLNHAEHSVLVTARNEELEIQERCLKAGIKLLPKSLVNYVKVIKDLSESSQAQLKSASMVGDSAGFTSKSDSSISVPEDLNSLSSFKFGHNEGSEGGKREAYASKYVAENEARTSDAQDAQNQKTLIVLIDDDKLVRYNWSSHCEKKGIQFKAFVSIDSFLDEASSIPKEAKIYIDSNLGNDVKGEIESEKIFHLGFKNLYLATGYGKEYIKKPDWIIEIYSKSPEII
jgi:signal transduction histidine kinase/FixJ family two-component response regulator